MNGRAFLLAASVHVSACGDVDLKPPEQATTTDGATDSTGASSGPAECPGVADPECTTSAACGNQEICVSCECVPQPSECDDPGAANCLEDSDCAELEACSNCTCVSKCLPDAPNECSSDADCDRGAACVVGDTDLCVCEVAGECPEDAECVDDEQCTDEEWCEGCVCMNGMSDTTGGSPPLEGESDPVDDCTNDEGAAACVPSMDLETVAMSCVGGDSVVRIQVASGMVNGMPADYDTFQVFFQPTGGGEAHWVRAFGQPAGYECDYRIGAAYMPLGPGDVCELNAADGTFDFTLSAATSGGATFESVTVESTLSTPYLYDGAGPFDFSCP